MQLAAAAFVLAIVVGVPLGILSAVKRDTVFDNFGKLFATLGIATPNFWIAIMLIIRSNRDGNRWFAGTNYP